MSHLEKRPGLGQKLGSLVSGAPLVGELARPPLPGLQVEGGPDHVEEPEHDEAQVVQEVAPPAEEELEVKGNFCLMLFPNFLSNFYPLAQVIETEGG